jgi:hypothetical protein
MAGLRRGDLIGPADDHRRGTTRRGSPVILSEISQMSDGRRPRCPTRWPPRGHISGRRTCGRLGNPLAILHGTLISSPTRAAPRSGGGPRPVDDTTSPAWSPRSRRFARPGSGCTISSSRTKGITDESTTSVSRSVGPALRPFVRVPSGTSARSSWTQTHPYKLTVAPHIQGLDQYLVNELLAEAMRHVVISLRGQSAVSATPSIDVTQVRVFGGVMSPPVGRAVSISLMADGGTAGNGAPQKA